MASTEFDFLRCYDARALHANMDLPKTQTMHDYFSVAAEPKQSQAYSGDGSRDRPILIDSDAGSPRRMTFPQIPVNKKQRLRKRLCKVRRLIPTIHEPVDALSRLRKLVHSTKKVVVVSGAGISASAGFSTFQDMRKSQKTSFNYSLYSFPEEIISFHSLIRDMYERLYSDLTEPLPFHNFMNELARTRPYFRHYTQNIDCLECLLPNLEAKTVYLHGRIDQTRCLKCNWVSNYEPDLFQGAELADCSRCLERNKARILKGQRLLSCGRLRPNILLYGEPYPDDEEILETAKQDLGIYLELVLIVGTKLNIPGARSLAASFCHAARSVGGSSFWISKEEPVLSVKGLCDYVLIGDCDEVVSLDNFNMAK